LCSPEISTESKNKQIQRIKKEKTYALHKTYHGLMIMIMKKKFVLCSVCIIALIACIVSTGCTSSPPAQTPVPSNSPTTTTTSQPPSPTTPPATTAASLAQTTTPAATISTTATLTNDAITVTLNSAKKRTTLYNGGSLAPGNALLELDITIQNNDNRKDFEYTDESFVLSFKSIPLRQTAITTLSAKGLINPLISGTVPAGSRDEGKIVFGVNATSNYYKLSVVDATGTVLTSIDNIIVP
jgi:hypothetical protein